MNDKTDPIFQKALHTRMRMDEIAKAIEDGADPEQFDAEMDELLGTKMEDRDHAAEEVFEDDYRRRETD